MIPLLSAPPRKTSARRRSGAPAPSFDDGLGIYAVDGADVSITRRAFLERIGRTGGAVAVIGAMQAWAFAGTLAALWSPPAGRAPGRRSRHHPRRRGRRPDGGVRVAKARLRLRDARSALALGGSALTVRRGHRQRGVRVHRKRRRSIRACISTPAPTRIPHHHTRRSTIAASSALPSNRSTASTKPPTSTQRRPVPSEQRLRLRELRADWRG